MNNNDKIDQVIRRVRVKPELPPVMQCKNCGHLSHWTSDCDKCTLCLDCVGMKNGHGYLHSSEIIYQLRR